MAVAFDIAVESVRTATTDPYSWTHTPGVAPRGILVGAVQNGSSTDHIVGITYGGVAMSRVVSVADTAGEPGRVYWYFLGSGIPSGNQTVEVDLSSATGDDIQFVSISLNAASNTAIVDSDSTAGDLTNPSLTLQYAGKTSMGFAAIFSGLAAPTNLTPDGNMTAVADHDFGQQAGRIDRQTNAGTADFTLSYTSAADDVAFAAVAVTEATTVSSSATADANIKATITASLTANAYLKTTVTTQNRRIFYDTFTDANDTPLPSHPIDVVPSGGNASWSSPTGANLFVSDGVATGTTGDNNAYNVGVTNGTFKAVINNATGDDIRLYVRANSTLSEGLVFKRTGASWELHERVGNVPQAPLLSGSNLTSGAPVSIRIEAGGTTSPELFLDDVSQGTFSIENASGTHIGLTADAVGGTPFFDTIEVWTGGPNQFTADAHISAPSGTTYTGSFTADAYIKSVIAGSFTANAHIKSVDITQSVTADALVRRSDIAGSFTADAFVANSISGTFTADSNVAATVAGGLTADAYIRRLDLPGSFTADAYVKRVDQPGSLTADAYLATTTSASFTADSHIRATVGAALTADSHIRATITSSVVADAYLRRTDLTGGLTGDAYISATQSASLVADAYILRTASASLTADAHLRATVASSLTADAYVKATLTGSFTADAYLRTTTSASLTADAYIKATQSASVTADAHIGRVARVYWTTPTDGELISATPELRFRIPSAIGPVHFYLQLDTVNTFNSGSLREYRSSRDQTGWEYWNGTTWTPVPASGVPTTYAGNEARFTVSTALAAGTWYRRIAAGA